MWPFLVIQNWFQFSIGKSFHPFWSHDKLPSHWSILIRAKIKQTNKQINNDAFWQNSHCDTNDAHEMVYLLWNNVHHIKFINRTILRIWILKAAILRVYMNEWVITYVCVRVYFQLSQKITIIIMHWYMVLPPIFVQIALSFTHFCVYSAVFSIDSVLIYVTQHTETTSLCFSCSC